MRKSRYEVLRFSSMGKGSISDLGFQILDFIILGVIGFGYGVVIG